MLNSTVVSVAVILLLNEIQQYWIIVASKLLLIWQEFFYSVGH